MALPVVPDSPDALNTAQLFANVGVGTGPIQNPRSWDYVTMAGINSPGIVTLSGFDRVSSYDQKHGKGGYGSVLTYTGKPLLRGRLTFKLWTDNQILVQWPSFSALFNYDPTKSEPPPVQIQHPGLSLLGIEGIIAERVGPILHKGGQLYEVTIEVLEWAPPPAQAAVATPVAAIVNPPPGSGVTDQPQPPSPAQVRAAASVDALANAINSSLPPKSNP